MRLDLPPRGTRGHNMRMRTSEELQREASLRILNKIEIGGPATYGDTSCWNWLGYVRDNGYCGAISYLGKVQGAHRLSYTLFRGEIPANLELDHLCNNPRCVNPDHLEPVPGYVNLMRSNALSARRARQTHCKYGHEFTSENTYISSRGERMCRPCRAAREYARRHGLDFLAVVRDRMERT